MIVEHAVFLTHPDRGESFEAAYREVHEVLLQAPGCVSAALHREVQHPGQYLLAVTWETVEHHVDLFPNTEQGRAVVAALAPHFLSADVKHFDIDPLT